MRGRVRGEKERKRERGGGEIDRMKDSEIDRGIERESEREKYMYYR